MSRPGRETRPPWEIEKGAIKRRLLGRGERFGHPFEIDTQ